MKKLQKLMLVTALAMLAVSCDTGLDGGRETASAHNTFILCEGNFGYANASLWALDSDLQNLDGPIHWTLDGSNPLGDIGQSMYLNDQTLYIVMNNSHTVEMMDVSTDTSFYAGSIEIPGSGPRHIAVRDSLAYISTYWAGGIIVWNLEKGAAVDTVALNAGCLPEKLLIEGDRLYCTSRIHSDWTANDEMYIFSFSEDGLVREDMIKVCYGPESMLVHNGNLYISGIYYDSFWNSYISQAVMDLQTGDLSTANYGRTYYLLSDMFLFNNEVWRSVGKQYGRLNEDLTVEIPDNIPDLEGLYTINASGNYIIAGTTDYQADNKILIIDGQGTVLRTFETGASPTEILTK